MKTYLTILAALGTAIAAAALALILWPIAKSVAWALIIGIATLPHYRRLHAIMPRSANWSAAIMVTVMTLFMVLPVTALVLYIAQNVLDWYRELERFLVAVAAAKKNTLSHVPMAHRMVVLMERIGIDITGYASRMAAGTSKTILDAAAGAAMNVASMLFNLLMALFILFFVYRDGERIVRAGIERFATDREKALYYAGEVRSTTTAVMVGTIFTCFVQGVLAGASFYVVGLEVPVLLGVLTAVAGLLPVLGTTVVWGPAVVSLALHGEWLKAGLLGAWCVLVVVAVADNVIRPLAVGAKRNIPALAVILGAVGGVMAIGLLGLILGPILLALVVTVWRDLTAQDTAE